METLKKEIVGTRREKMKRNIKKIIGRELRAMQLNFPLNQEPDIFEHLIRHHSIRVVPLQEDADTVNMAVGEALYGTDEDCWESICGNASLNYLWPHQLGVIEKMAVYDEREWQRAMAAVRKYGTEWNKMIEG